MTTGTQIKLALLSHTNAGKTTLARTLLRKDIGAVMDRPHVTETAESHVLVRTDAGDELVLWDTPGFGDSVRLLRRLEQARQPLGWFLSQVWDRLADRPFWCSQQAMRAARESADVLLYVANATEDPQAAGYVAPELRILRWFNKPTLVLLNQLGTRIDRVREAEIARRWHELLAATGSGTATRVLPFDAFARCWIQEHTLLQAIAGCVAESQHPAFDRIRGAWSVRDEDVLQQSAAVIVRQMSRVAADVERIPDATLADKARGFWRGGGPAKSPEEERAQRALLQRLDAAVREGTTELVALHGLTGGASEEILANLGREFSTQRAPDADRAGLIGGIVTGALSGLAADLAAGGLTFGAGALLGGVAGAFGARKLTQLYNAERGVDGGSVRWSDEFLASRIEAAIVRYLAVAHYGRGRGDFQADEPDPRWQHVAAAVVDVQSNVARELCLRLRQGPVFDEDAVSTMRGLLWRALQLLYPEATGHFRAAKAREP
jgi:GTPase SAR1 family protein